ncbi:MAG TPA: glycosyltransferase family 4 protein [Candidatus Sulfotelmatobacter sp.]|nr:glycosyltransferase family 4 protein [Candidatus Sulfotelmatobacter sp.]
MPSEITNSSGQRVIFFVNGIFSENIGGGDIYFYHMARATIDAGYGVHYFGGHAFQNFLRKMNLPLDLTLTDDGPGNLGNVATLPGQFRLLWDFRRRLLGALSRLDEVKPDDIAYASSDYWFDTIPLMRSCARKKMLYLGMIAPSFSQVLLKSRADVTPTRLASLYYWMSQHFSLRRFRSVPDGILTYSHPEMRDYALKLGYRESRLRYVPNGSDLSAADRVTEQPKKFDAVWTGRVHPQKGIDDLLATLAWLKQQLPDFRAVVIGKSKDLLEPKIREMGLAENITFSGLVSEEEKFRLLKSSRVFLMPSYYESWGIVVGEALAAGVPVVAYDLSCYRPVFGDFVRYAPCFDRQAFKRMAEDEIRNQREGRNYLAKLDLRALTKSLDWKVSQANFVGAIKELASTL